MPLAKATTSAQLPIKERDKGTLGKWAEGEVRDELKKLANANFSFTFNRVPDARMARGKFPGQAGDFQWFYKTDIDISKFNHGIMLTLNGLIEVKQVEHACRLPHKNFSEDKVARLKQRWDCGSEAMILVAHRLPGMVPKDVVWRNPPFEFFLTQEGGSWDLSSFPAVDFKSIISGLVLPF